jgi:hypothetical protein
MIYERSRIMNRIKRTAGAILATLTLLLPLSEGLIVAAPASSDPEAVNSRRETLNPEGINPHAGAPRKRITQEQKKAAADARKKKQAEKAAQKAGQPGHLNSTGQGASIGAVNK